jgi:hypothetical protein
MFWDGDKQTGVRSDVVMSGVVGSGQEIGHGNIDANDPEGRSALNFAVMQNGPDPNRA